MKESIKVKEDKVAKMKDSIKVKEDEVAKMRECRAYVEEMAKNPQPLKDLDEQLRAIGSFVPESALSEGYITIGQKYARHVAQVEAEFQNKQA